MMEDGASRVRGAVGMLAGTIGLGGLAFGIKDVVQAGEQLQAQQAQLRGALQATHAPASAFKTIMEQTEKLATHGGFAPMTQLAAITKFIGQTHSATTALNMNALATDIARRTGVDYTTATTLLGRAMTGTAGKLQQYIGVIQPVKAAQFALSQAHGVDVLQLTAQSKALGKLGPLWLQQQELLHHLTPQMVQHAQLLDKQATATMVLGRVQATFGGATQRYSRTVQGSISDLKNKFDILAASIGTKALPIVKAIVGFLAGHTTAVLVFGGAIIGLGLAMGAASLAAGRVGGRDRRIATAAAAVASGALSFMTVALWAAEVAFDALGLAATVAWGAATLGIVAGIILIVTHFKQFKQIVADVLNWITGHWRGLIIILTGPIGLAVVLIVDHFNQIKRVAGAVVGWFKGAWQTVEHALAGPFEAAWRIIQGIANKVKGVFSAITGVGGSIVHSVGGFLAHPFGLSRGGIVPHMANGGIIGGYGTSDTIPAMLTPGEQVLTRRQVQGMAMEGNSVTPTGGIVGPGADPSEVYVLAPIKVYAGQRVLAETVVHASARKAALAGRYVSG